MSRLFPAVTMLVVWLAPPAPAQTTVTISGTITDQSGGALPHATVTLLRPPAVVVRATETGADGRFSLERVAPGRYALDASAGGFSSRRVAVEVGTTAVTGLVVALELGAIQAEVTVTASRGSVEDPARSVQAVNVIGRDEIAVRAKAVVAQLASEEPGLALQRTSPTIGGIFVRGLTGNKVNVFVDGVRYSTSAMRGGISTFLNLIDPTNLDTLEVLRGPNSAQYGSDAIGGSLQFVTRSPVLSGAAGVRMHASIGGTATSADQSIGSYAGGSIEGRHAALLLNVAGRRVNPIRTGGGFDTHAAVTRFLGLPSTAIGRERLPDTGFTQYGGSAKLHWAPAPQTTVVASYSRGQQDGGKRYDQLLGGDGNLVADLRFLMNDFAYLRVDRAGAGWFDQVSGAYSLNIQREERVNQGGNGNPRNTITFEPERMKVHGGQTTAGRQFGTRQQLLVGGDATFERIAAPSYQRNPTTGATAPRRGRVPDGARYASGGAFAQHTGEIVPGRLSSLASVRLSGARYEARAADSPVVGGVRLWPDDGLRAASVTYKAGLVGQVRDGLSVSGSVSRGFRAPHITDLGTLGLTGSGFEVAAPDVAGLHATIGSRADRNAVSTGEPVAQVRPETSVNYEAAAHLRRSRVSADAWVFVNDLSDSVEKAALILPAGAVGQSIAGTPIVSQAPGGAVFVAASTAPVLVRTNTFSSRVRGLEFAVTVKPTPRWTIRAVGSAVRAADRTTGLPPTIEGGTPAPEAHVSARYMRLGGRAWIDLYARAARTQTRLSTLDLEDRRTGATRSRTSIRNFFLNGATVRGLVSSGPDGVFGSADDVLVATGETLAEVQDRVLGVGVDSAPLFTRVPGFATVGLRGGLRIGTAHVLGIDLENLTDRNYRGISWGMDAPGRSATVTWRSSF